MSKAPERSRYERYILGAVLILLLLGCYLVVRPFLTAFLWGAIIAISTRGVYKRVLKLIGGRRKLASTLTAFLLAAVLLVPIGGFAIRLAAEMPELMDRVQGMLAGGLSEPPSWLTGLPLIGKRASEWWVATAANPEKLRQDLRPLIGPVKDFLLSAAAGIGLGVLEFILALVIAALLYSRGEETEKLLNKIAFRVGGEFARKQLTVVRSTVKSVFNGILGTCAAQAILAMIGFWIAGVPRVLLLGMGTFFLSVIPGGPTVLWLPAAIWLNSARGTGWAIFMAVWGLVIVGGSDNFIRPLLIGKGVEAPLSLVFLGVIGGVLSFGFLGLFIGPTLLVVAYNLFQEWMAKEEKEESPATAR
ncbi:MAG TPA: AI-2E family transporter [Thermoanaerobaculia bacterium]